jgi:hypothetical protein
VVASRHRLTKLLRAALRSTREGPSAACGASRTLSPVGVELVPAAAGARALVPLREAMVPSGTQVGSVVACEVARSLLRLFVKLVTACVYEGSGLNTFEKGLCLVLVVSEADVVATSLPSPSTRVVSSLCLSGCTRAARMGLSHCRVQLPARVSLCMHGWGYHVGAVPTRNWQPRMRL